MVQRKGVVAVVLVFVFVAVCRWTDPRTTRQSQSEFQVKANNLWVSVSDSKDLALVSPDETPVQPKRRLFWCGGNHGGQQIFPEMEFMGRWDVESFPPNSTTPDDVLVVVGRYVQKDERSGWQANPTVQDLQNYVYNRQSLPVVHPAAVASDGFYRNWDLLRDPSKRVRNNGKFHAIAWLQSNCKAKARRKALENLSRNVPVPVHFGGRCEVGTGFNPQNQRMSENVDLSEPNTKIFNNFKYCLVMESKNRQGYITEKLINAYYSGCLPIYQGSRDPNRPDREFDIFRIFNPHSMVYYDTSNPGEAVKLMRELEANETEYERRISAPILHNSTSEQYFSLSPKIGGGYINRRVREMMGIPPLELFDV